MKTHSPVRPSRQPAVISNEPAETELSRPAAQASTALAPPINGAFHDFSKMTMAFRGSTGDEIVHAAARQGASTPSSALPYVDRIQRSFGRHDIGAARAHSGPDAAGSARAMGAMAYTSGDHVVLNRGADLRTVAHEAAHMVQQRHGVSLAGGTSRAGDAYERHADAVADRVVAGQSAEGLLDRMAGRGAARPAASNSPVVQAMIFARPLPGQISGYYDNGRVKEHQEATLVGSLAHKMIVRRDTAQAADNANNPNEAQMAKHLPKGGYVPEGVGKSDVDRAKSRARVDTHRSHKLSSKYVQDTIVRWASGAIGAAGATAAQEGDVKNIVEAIKPVNWLSSEPATPSLKKSYEIYRAHAAQNYDIASKELQNATTITGTIKAFKQNRGPEPDAKDSGVGSLNALAEAVANAPQNFFYGDKSLNESGGRGTDVNVTAPASSSSSAAAKPSLERQLTPESRQIAEKIGLQQVVAPSKARTTDFNSQKKEVDKENAARQALTQPELMLVHSSAAGYIAVPQTYAARGEGPVDQSAQAVGESKDADDSNIHYDINISSSLAAKAYRDKVAAARASNTAANTIGTVVPSPVLSLSGSGGGKDLKEDTPMSQPGLTPPLTATPSNPSLNINLSHTSPYPVVTQPQKQTSFGGGSAVPQLMNPTNSTIPPSVSPFGQTAVASTYNAGGGHSPSAMLLAGLPPGGKPETAIFAPPSTANTEDEKAGTKKAKNDTSITALKAAPKTADTAVEEDVRTQQAILDSFSNELRRKKSSKPGNSTATATNSNTDNTM